MARRGSPLHKLHKFSNEGLKVYFDHVADFQKAAKEKGFEDVIKETQVYLDSIKKEGDFRKLELA